MGGAAKAADGRRGVFEADETAALAELETAWAASGLPRRPAAGAAQARAHLEYQGSHWAPGPDSHSWAADPAVLRRVRDALASGRQL